MKTLKKSLAVLMSVLMLLSVVSVSAFAAEVKLEYLPGRYSTDTAPAAIMVEKNSTVTLLGAIFTREGYEQTGWSTSSSGSRKNYELGDSFKITKNTKLYPYWEAAKIKVTFAPGANGVGAAVVEEVASGKTTNFWFVGELIKNSNPISVNAFCNFSAISVKKMHEKREPPL